MRSVTAARHLSGRFGKFITIRTLSTAPTARGQGVAQALLRQIEDEARQNALPVLRLETGDKLAAAHWLYQAFGFQNCGPFGGYSANASSLFMEKPLG